MLITTGKGNLRHFEKRRLVRRGLAAVELLPQEDSVAPGGWHRCPANVNLEGKTDPDGIDWREKIAHTVVACEWVGVGVWAGCGASSDSGRSGAMEG